MVGDPLPRESHTMGRGALWEGQRPTFLSPNFYDRDVFSVLCPFFTNGGGTSFSPWYSPGARRGESEYYLPKSQLVYRANAADLLRKPELLDPCHCCGVGG